MKIIIALLRTLTLLILLFTLGIVIMAQEETSEPEIIPEATAEPVTEINYTMIPQRQREDGAFVLGEEEAILTVIIFSDFLCVDCAEYAPTITRFIENYVIEGLAQIEYRLFPVTGENSSSFAQLAECAGKQDAFWEARAWLFQQFSDIEQPESGNIPALPTIDETLFITELQLDEDDFEQCLVDASQYLTDSLLAVEIDVISTPAVMFRLNDSPPQWVRVNGEIFNEGGLSYELLELAVEATNH